MMEMYVGKRDEREMAEGKAREILPAWFGNSTDGIITIEIELRSFRGWSSSMIAAVVMSISSIDVRFSIVEGN